MGERQLVKTEEVGLEKMSLEESQLAEQLYNSAGLDPVVDAGLKDYHKRLLRESKLLNKVLGPRGSDMKGYGEAVAKRVAFAVYTLLNKQYGGKVGDLRSYIMTLEEERNLANANYDELMGRVVGILGEEYKDLRTDSKAFVERLTAVLGEDLKESRIDHEALAERLADIDGLRSQIKTLDKEKEKLKERHESQITALKNEHKEEVGNLRSQIAELDSRIKGLESEKVTLAGELKQLSENHNQLEAAHEALTKDYGQLQAAHEALSRDYDQLKAAIATLAEAIPYEEIKKKLGEELYHFVLHDSKVPGMVIDGVGKFIDFKKYLGIAAERGGKEAYKYVEEILGKTLKIIQ